MKHAPGRAVSFDIWARGNYTRRLIHNTSTQRHPLIIPCRSVEEMRWAFRRLSLLGMPVDLVYTGGVSAPKNVLHLYPAEGLIGPGWGYIGALGSIARIRGRKWFPVIGVARLMPERILDWLYNEASEEFSRGDVFVAPAELIGIDPSDAQPGLQTLAEVALGERVDPDDQAIVHLANLEIPYIDKMRPAAFRRFLRDHEEEFTRFRSVFKKLSAEAGTDLRAVVEELRVEVADLSLSERYASLRRTISRFGGALATCGAAVAAAVAASPETALPIAASAGAAGATATLFDLWKQRAEYHEAQHRSPYYILWKLGVDRPSRVQRTPVAAELRRLHRLENATEKNLGDFHWLCPPTPGLRLAVVPVKLANPRGSYLQRLRQERAGPTGARPEGLTQDPLAVEDRQMSV